MFKIISIGKVSKQQIYCPVGIDAKKYINLLMKICLFD